MRITSPAASASLLATSAKRSRSESSNPTSAIPTWLGNAETQLILPEPISSFREIEGNLRAEVRRTAAEFGLMKSEREKVGDEDREIGEEERLRGGKGD